MSLFARKTLVDIVERTVKTFAQTWAALLTASGLSVIDTLALWAQVQVSALAALAAFMMGVAGPSIGAATTAAWLPKGPDTDRGHTTLPVLIGACAAVLLLALLNEIDL
jgi:hypothetical protein